MHNQIQWCNSSPACHLFQYLSELRSTVAIAIPTAPGLRPVQRQYVLVRQSKQLFFFSFFLFFGGTNFDDVTVQAVSQIAAVHGMGYSRKGCGVYCTRPELAMSSRISPILNLRPLWLVVIPDFFFLYFGMRQPPFFCTALQVCASSAGHLLVHSSLRMRVGDWRVV